MARHHWGIVSGLAVLALGVFAITSLLEPAEVPVEAVPATSFAQGAASTLNSRPTAIAPELPGVPSEVTRVLEWNGDAGFASEDDLAQLPPTVAAVLTQYGVPLRVSITVEGQ